MDVKVCSHFFSLREHKVLFKILKEILIPDNLLVFVQCICIICLTCNVCHLVHKILNVRGLPMEHVYRFCTHV